ncbi:MAG TPA: hypothetical protein VFN35_25520 [Ktedonobacteraceae bacterium]|nr:hypothetical protein [Ktedonobacteraceae bacterium]
MCLCFTPAATGEEKVLNGAKAYPSSFKGNDYRCKFCNTLPIVDNEPADAFKLKEALYDKVYLWFTTPGSGPGLSTNEEKPICVMLDYNGLEQRESGIINGRYHRDTKIITVARAVTPVMFIAIFAHELTHYWQDQQGLPDKQEKMIYEGFAEWVAYTCLTTMLPGFTEERDKQEAPRMLEQMKSNLSLAYSDGLKHFLKIEKTQGRAGVLLEAQKVEKEV